MLSQDDEMLRLPLIDALTATDVLEQQSVAILGQHEQAAQAAPEIQAELHEQLGRAQQHHERLAERLRVYGREPRWDPHVTDVLAPAMLLGTPGGVLTQHMVDAYIVEHRQIASYILLIAIAHTAEDQDTVQVGLSHLQDDLQMARWLEHHLAVAAMLALQYRGFVVAPSTIFAVAQQISSVLSQAPYLVNSDGDAIMMSAIQSGAQAGQESATSMHPDEPLPEEMTSPEQDLIE